MSPGACGFSEERTDTMGKVRKAVITAAGKGTRLYPGTQAVQKELFPLVDVDGVARAVIHIIAGEALAAHVEEICIVASPASLEQYKKYFAQPPVDLLNSLSSKPWAAQEVARLEHLAERISYAVQETQEGYGHAVYCARHFTGDECFLLMLGDHIYITDQNERCASQMIRCHEEHETPVSGVWRAPESLLHLYGTVAGVPVPDAPRVYEATAIYEKPTPEYARRFLRTPGLDEGTYLCFFGMHVLPPAIYDCIKYHIDRDLRLNGEIQLTNAQELLRSKQRYLALEVEGKAYDMGVPAGLLATQTALGLRSPFAGVVIREVEAARADEKDPVANEVGRRVETG